MPSASADSIFVTIVCVLAAFEAFNNTGVLTIALLFVISKCLDELGSIDFVMRFFLGSPKTLIGTLVRLSVTMAIASIFVATTALVRRESRVRRVQGGWRGVVRFFFLPFFTLCRARWRC